MKKNKKYILLLIILLLFTFIPNISFSNQVSEENDPVILLMNVAEISGYEEDGDAPFLEEMLGSIVQTILSFLGIIFLILIIISGYQWMTAGGNEESIAKAKKRIINATIGLAVVILSYAISYFIMWAVYKSSGVV